MINNFPLYIPNYGLYIAAWTCIVRADCLLSSYCIPQFSSVAQSCPTLCDPMDCSTPGFPVHHQLMELTKLTSIELGVPSNHLILCHPLLLPPSIFPSLRVFSNESVLCTGGQSIGVSASTSVLPMNIQDWCPLGWTGWISLQSKGLSRVFSNTTVQKHQFFGVQPSLLSGSHIQTRHWKNYRFDYMDLCWQSDVSAF